MAAPYRPIEAIRAALLADPILGPLVDIRIGVPYPWGVNDLVYPLITVWQEADNQAVTLPRTNDPCRIRVDAYSQVDADEAAQMYERIFLTLHGGPSVRAMNALVTDVCVKECRQIWNMYPVWNAKLNAWVVPTRFLVRACTLV